LESHLARKLRYGSPLGAQDIARLDALSAAARPVPAGTDLIREGDNPGCVHLVTAGVAGRTKYLPDGRRAIIGLLLPGDFCDLHVAIIGRMDHAITTLADSEVARIPQSELDALLETSPRIARACWWATLVDEAVLREWLVNVGRRASERQLAHLFCELYTRQWAVGLARDNSLPMPFTQATLADLLGITAVHVQRVMAGLRKKGLIALEDRQLTIRDFEALAALGEFDPAYLHLGHAAETAIDPHVA